MKVLIFQSPCLICSFQHQSQALGTATLCACPLHSRQPHLPVSNVSRSSLALPVTGRQVQEKRFSSGCLHTVSVILHWAWCPVTRETQNPVPHNAISFLLLTLQGSLCDGVGKGRVRSGCASNRTPGCLVVTESMGTPSCSGSEPWALPAPYFLKSDLLL